MNSIVKLGPWDICHFKDRTCYLTHIPQRKAMKINKKGWNKFKIFSLTLVFTEVHKEKLFSYGDL